MFLWRGTLEILGRDLLLVGCCAINDTTMNIHRLQNEYKDVDGNSYFATFEFVCNLRCMRKANPWRARVINNSSKEEFTKTFTNAKTGLSELAKQGLKFPFDIENNYDFILKYPVDTEVIGDAITEITDIDSIRDNIYPNRVYKSTLDKIQECREEISQTLSTLCDIYEESKQISTDLNKLQ